MTGYILAIDQGTTSSRAIVFDGDDEDRRRRPEGIHPALSRSPAGSSMTRRRSGTAWSGDLQDGASKAAKCQGRRHRGDRHHQPARDRRHLGPADRQADPQRHRLAGPAHRAASAQKLKKQGLEKTVHPQDRAAARPLFLRHQDRLAARQCEGRAQARREGRTASGTIDSFLIWRLTGGKVHATDATNASRTLLYNIGKNQLGRRAAGAASTCRAALLPEVKDCADDFGVTDAGAVRRRDPDPAASPATSRRRPSARPASSRA